MNLFFAIQGKENESPLIGGLNHLFRDQTVNLAWAVIQQILED
jgi:hypothetical protein